MPAVDMLAREAILVKQSPQQAAWQSIRLGRLRGCVTAVRHRSTPPSPSDRRRHALPSSAGGSQRHVLPNAGLSSRPARAGDQRGGVQTARRRTGVADRCLIGLRVDARWGGGGGGAVGRWGGRAAGRWR